MTNRLYAILIAGVLCANMALVPFAASAQTLALDPGFDPNHILDDSDIFDVNAMDHADLITFLRAKGTLANAQVTDIDGVTKTAADVIWRVANTYKLNPKYLLALIQKEQSLVEDPAPSQRQFDWAAGYGVCDSCSTNDPSISDFKGFANQLEWAAKQYREKYLLQILSGGTTLGGTRPGLTIDVDGMPVTPVNNATAMLYAYTPHLHGNLNLWRIWQRWFSQAYPDGTVVKSEPSGNMYLIRLGQKRLFASPAVAISMTDPDKAISTSDTDLASYPDGPVIRFPKYALVKDLEGRIYLLTGDVKRHIENMEAFHKFGFNEDEVVTVDNDTELTDYPDGPSISVDTQFPQGVVLQDATGGTLWYVEDGVRHIIMDPVMLALYFRGRNVRKAEATELRNYTVGDPYQFHDGELVRRDSEPAVYVVQQGTLRPFLSADTFESMGYQWQNVVMVSDAALNGYTIGAAMSLQPNVPTVPQPTTLTASDSTGTVSAAFANE